MSESVPFLVRVRPVALALVGLVGLGFPLIAAATVAPDPSGRAVVIDGDTIDIDGQRIRLEGIDAPEHAQTCGRKWLGSWPCGAAATRALEGLIGSRRVDCHNEGHDKYGRILGVCSINGRDINAEMVRSGYAWAFVKYSARYVAEEAEARKAKSGVWQGEAEPAWVFREKKWNTAEVAAPSGCAIKGNITANGHIYHMPWSPWYGKVKVEPLKGEQWFCSEADAAKAGFRPVQSH